MTMNLDNGLTYGVVLSGTHTHLEFSWQHVLTFEALTTAVDRCREVSQQFMSGRSGALVPHLISWWPEGSMFFSTV